MTGSFNVSIGKNLVGDIGSAILKYLNVMFRIINDLSESITPTQRDFAELLM